MKLSEICQKLGITYNGEDREIAGLNALQDAGQNEVSFLENPKYASQLSATNAAAVLVTASMAQQLPAHSIPLIVDEPYIALAKASAFFAPQRLEHDLPEAAVGAGTVIEAGAFVAKGSTIGQNCHIMPGVFIGNNVTVGDNTILYPNVTVYRDCRIGSDCIIHAGTVIGSDGFGFATTKLGEHVKIYQNGNAVIEDDVEIGSNTTIDRAVFKSTVIKKGARIDNLVQVGHNCVIGEYSVLVSQVGLAGSSRLGRNVVMGGQSATAGHLSIAPFTTIAARGGVTKNVDKAGVYGGFPLMEHKLWLKLQGKLARLLKA
ncbi:UDP-3-O-(3-hydroxymyristoyl)glucosamine N-acyltransferase [Sulfurimonas sp. HSL1-2]|uniref:UDP-3-O-(3-hydroxymyristoyl)glucosamine N-acyltransferase n=1 Tax=Thiomicrolovo zhangzhouensis TaxID=3131933 RepID=UPI0031F91333